MKFSIVIVTYNRLELLKKCIYNAINQTYKAQNIIIINNCSTDGTKEYLETIKNSNVRIYNIDENLGGAGGFSLGVEKAIKYNDDWVVLIDDDAILDLYFLQNIFEGLEKNKDILACSGTVKVNGKIDTSHRCRIKNQLIYSESLVPINEYEKETFLCDTASFCGLVVNMTLIKKINVPEKDFFIWFDDTEYSLRIRKFTPILNINNAIINHESIMLADNKINWKSYYGIRNRMVMIKKHCGKIAVIYNFLKLRTKYFLNYLNFSIKKDNDKKYVMDIYKDAINDYINNNMGKNQKYMPKLGNK